MTLSRGDYERCERPRARKRDLSGLTSQLIDTLTKGDAVRVPIRDDENYAVARNRAAARAFTASRIANAKLRTQKSDDGRAVVLWLEPKVAEASAVKLTTRELVPA